MDSPSHHLPKPSPLANDITFGIEQTALCLSTDGYTDPLISDKIQRTLGGEHPNNLRENFIAEIGGDTAGLVAFVVVRQLFRPLFNGARDKVRKTFDSFYDRILRKKLHLENDAPLSDEQARRLDAWKNSEADTMVQSVTLSGLSTLANAAILKGRHSPYGWPALLVSKFAASAVTAVSMIGLRLVLPKPMMKLDRALDRHVVSPTINFTQKGLHKLGVTSAPAPLEAAPTDANAHDTSWQDRVQRAAPEAAHLRA